MFIKELKRNSLRCKALTLLLTVAVAAGCSMAMPAKADAATKNAKNALVKSRTTYYYNDDAKRWEKTGEAKYSYNKKKDPTVIVSKSTWDGTVSKETMTWKYKKGKKVKMTCRDTGITTVCKYKKGKKVSMKETSVDGEYKTILTCKNSFDKKGSLYKQSCVEKDYDENKTLYANRKWNCSSKYRYYKNGLPKSMTYYADGEKFSTFAFNKRGLVTKITSPKWSGGTRWIITYKYNKKKQVAQSFMSYQIKNEGKWDTISKWRVVYTYTKKTIKAKRYAKMINSIEDDDMGSCRFATVPYEGLDIWY